MRKIFLTQGKVALVDDADFERLAKHSWYYDGGYAKCDQRYKHIMMTNVILQISGLVDHKDGNSLNNQRSNLRLCTLAQNNQNKKKRLKYTSKYKGVSFNKQHKKWNAVIGLTDIFGQYYTKSLKYFFTQKEAAQAYDKAARFYFGEFAALNFPNEGEQGAFS